MLNEELDKLELLIAQQQHQLVLTIPLISSLLQAAQGWGVRECGEEKDKWGQLILRAIE